MEYLLVEGTHSHHIVRPYDFIRVVDLLQEARLRDLQRQPGQLLQLGCWGQQRSIAQLQVLRKFDIHGREVASLNPLTEYLFGRQHNVGEGSVDCNYAVPFVGAALQEVAVLDGSFRSLPLGQPKISRGHIKISKEDQYR